MPKNHFWPILGLFFILGHFRAVFGPFFGGSKFFGHWTSYGVITDQFGGAGQGLGGPGGVKRGLLYPQRALLSPLVVLYGTKFGSKHYIMDRMANVYKVSL